MLTITVWWIGMPRMPESTSRVAVCPGVGSSAYHSGCSSAVASASVQMLFIRHWSPQS
ncbi:hypothetical protein [Serinicoccus sp. CUA-874]|uniref:hypothetical protein n=1 Tax=Serinicoccus sp. CUA-874 TaxID=1517939 RepID=UPI0013010D89|nr:hypothetical protein [Serinicoccus sp. CUA-874]